MEAPAALRVAGGAVDLIGDDLDRWEVGALIFSDSELWRFAVSHGLVEDCDSR